MNDGGGRYDGAVVNNKLNGFGVFLHAKTDIKGDRYRGEFKNGTYSNVGVYEYGQNPANKFNTLRYEGDFVNGVATGHGAFIWRDGTTYNGGLVGGFLGGAGVQAWTDGRRYEGEFDKGVRVGMGVLWNADGSVGSAGRWANGELAENIAR
jgi:hypothetical protein